MKTTNVVYMCTAKPIGSTQHQQCSKTLPFLFLSIAPPWWTTCIGPILKFKRIWWTWKNDPHPPKILIHMTWIIGHHLLMKFDLQFQGVVYCITCYNMGYFIIINIWKHFQHKNLFKFVKLTLYIDTINTWLM